MVRSAPGTRGGQRKAGTASPASWVAAPRRRATSAKRMAGSWVTVRSFTVTSIAPGYDINPCPEPASRRRSCATTDAETGAGGGRRYDREIVRLAVPALGALAAEPLYLLADTAIVGHLGTRPLAGLAVAGSVLTAAFSVFNFLAYTTTAAVARQLGAGHRRDAAASRRRRLLARGRSRVSCSPCSASRSRR